MSERRAAERRGRSAEFLCAWALRCKGYRVLDRRARGPLGEIGIVARRRAVLAIVEVKARREASAALEATTARPDRPGGPTLSRPPPGARDVAGTLRSDGRDTMAIADSHPRRLAPAGLMEPHDPGGDDGGTNELGESA